MALAIEDIPFATIAVDDNNVISELNSLAIGLTGYKENVLVGQPLSLILTACSSQQIAFPSQYNAQPQQFLLTTEAAEAINLVGQVKQIADLTYFYLFKPESELKEVTPSLIEPTRDVLEKLDETYWEWDLASDLIYLSPELMALLGYQKRSAHLHSNFWRKHVEGDDWRLLGRSTICLIRGTEHHYSITLQISTLEQHVLWVSATANSVKDSNGKVTTLYGAIRNITETKSLIKQLKKQNEYLSLAEKISNSGHWRYDVKHHKMFWSTELYRIFGTEPHSFTPSIDNELDFHTEEDRERVKKIFFHSISNAQSYYNKSTIVLPGGKKTKIESIGEVEVDSNGDVVALFGICRDITRSELIFEKLKLLAMVNYTIKVPIFFIDEDDNVVYQELSPQKGEDNKALFTYVNFSISDYLKLKSIAKKDGQLKRTSISFDDYNTVFDLSVTYESDEGIYIWIVENVTEKFKKEQQQVITNRLTLLGNTFGGVSHDINNVLGVALGAIEMLEIKSSQGEKDLSRYIDRVKNAIDKGKSVTERLLAFTKKPPVSVVSFDPIQEILDNQYLFQQMIISTIKLQFKLPKARCTIHFPQGEFINILLNLVLNSQDAIKEKGLSGTILISASYSVDGYFEVHVIDSGTGIETDKLTKIFDPFYSSKAKTKGYGLGLANVYNTIYKHNGTINVHGSSDLGGAHFILTFKCKKEFKPHVLNEYAGTGLMLKQQRILILDDEESIAEFVALFLETNGAITVHVNNEQQLIEVLKNSPPFDVFITDMILPGLTGKEAVGIVLARQPNIKVLSMSGYLESGNETWEYPLLQKPFNSKELTNFLRCNIGDNAQC